MVTFNCQQYPLTLRKREKEIKKIAKEWNEKRTKENIILLLHKISFLCTCNNFARSTHDRPLPSKLPFKINKHDKIIFLLSNNNDDGQ